MRSVATSKSLGQQSPLAEEIIKVLMDHEDEEVRSLFLKKPHALIVFSF